MENSTQNTKMKFVGRRTCPMCNKEHMARLTVEEAEKFHRYKEGEGHIQTLLPELSPVEREFLKTGYCPSCQSLLFGNGNTTEKIVSAEKDIVLTDGVGEKTLTLPNGEQGFLVLDRYMDDNSLYIGVVTIHHEVWGDITTCLSDWALAQDETYLDSNNAKWAEELLIKKGIARPIGQQKSGFCTYTRVEIDIEKLHEYVRGYMIFM